ncbi:MAG: serine/threonine protein kinase, partial [Actinobacteria bacterium]|nr:serine/threonine protein kinase [Actinomycetota bacterium]
MTGARAPSTPPELPGYTVQRLVGLGGFADVFLYRQHLPARDVAVKVLLAPTLDDELRARFVTEANLMAQLSHHPAIVTVHHAGFAQDGRPFLVMEYCSQPSLAERYRTERLSVAECLRIGVRLASAVQTAHDAGILHRDIKPANVLTTDFGWPALTDFGIAATAGQGGGAAVGMSIPWAPPELVGARPSGDERSDVYSLAATIYSLLAGRSPFEVPGAANTAPELVARIERMSLPAVGRPDMPAALTAVLERAMDKEPARRYESAVAVARALQAVEQALGLPLTALDVFGHELGASPVDVARPTDPHPASDDEDATRLRPILELDPSGAAARHEETRQREIREIAPIGAPLRGDRSEPARSGSPQSGSPLSGSAQQGPAQPTTGPGTGRQERAGRSPRRVLVGALVALVLVLTAAVAAVVHRATGGPQASPTQFVPAPATVDGVVPSPTGLVGTRQADGSVVFTWVDPDPQTEDGYLWGVL